MQRRVVLGMLLLVLVAPAPPAGAGGPRLRIGTSGDYAPFSRVAGDDYVGFDITVARAFAHDHGYEVEWVPFAWPDLARELGAGHFDLAMGGVTVRAERSLRGRFSVPVMESGAVLLYDVAACAALLDVASPAVAAFDRPGLRIAVNRGGHLERLARARFAHAELLSVDDNAAVRDLLARHAVEAVVTDTLEAPHWQRGLAGVAVAGPWSADYKAYWLAPRHTALAHELDRWLLAREADGSLDGWRRQAFGAQPHPRTATPLAALLAAVDERLSLMPLVAAAKQHSGAALEDQAREARVVAATLAAVREAAIREGHAPPDDAAVAAFMDVQIEAAKAVQRAFLARARPTAAAPADLRGELRPALLVIGERMATLLVALHGSAPATDLEQRTARLATRWQLDAALAARLAAALRTLAIGTSGNDREPVSLR